MMTERERKIMELRDRGFRNGEIALLLDLKPAQVLTITKRYGDGESDGGFSDGIKRGTRDLRIAIQREHAEKMRELRA